MRAAGAVRRARRRAARPGSRRARAPSKRWSTGSSPWPPVTITAGAPSSCDPLGELACGSPSADERLGLGQVRRDDRREREEPRRRARRPRRPASSRAPELATITGSTTSGTGCSLEEVGDGLDRSRARRASRSSPRRRRCRRRPPRAAPRRTPAAPRGRPSTPIVFCAVSATIALMPWQPRRGERLQVGLDPGAAAGVGAGDRQARVEPSAPFAGMTRIRFVGCVLSPVRAPRWARLPSSRWPRALPSGTTCSRARSSRTSASSPPRAAAHARRFRTSCTRGCARRSRRAGRRALRAPGRGAGTRPRAASTSIVTTGTASGKTLAFNLPVLDALAREPKQRALYLYPTKALAQDQLRALGRARASRGSAPAIYDGDTPAERRWQIRKWANLILTNPDMLHVGVLPHHDRWGDVLSNLALRRRRRGARLPRRLRLARRERPAAAAAAGARLRRRAAVPARLGDDREPRRARRARCSASTSTVIGDDGAPRAERTVALWNPPLARRGARPARERARRGVAAAGGRSSSAACGRSASRRAARRPS